MPYTEKVMVASGVPFTPDEEHPYPPNPEEVEFETIQPTGGEGHVYDLIFNQAKNEVTLTEDSRYKTVLPLVATFIGSHDAWDALSAAQQSKYRHVIFNDDGGFGNAYDIPHGNSNVGDDLDALAANKQDNLGISEQGSTSKYLNEQGTFSSPPDTTYDVVSKTANGLAPQLPNETATTKYLRQDGTWAIPEVDKVKYKASYSTSGSISIATLVANNADNNVTFYYLDNTNVLTDWPSGYEKLYYVTVEIAKFNGAVCNVLINGCNVGGSPRSCICDNINGNLYWNKIVDDHIESISTGVSGITVYRTGKLCDMRIVLSSKTYSATGWNTLATLPSNAFPIQAVDFAGYDNSTSLFADNKIINCRLSPTGILSSYVFSDKKTYALMAQTTYIASN